jgi:peroxiredoxin
MEKDIYVEYSNNEIEYLSFSKGKRLILSTLPHAMTYSCCDKEKSNLFLNFLLRKYKIVNCTLLLK